MRSLHLIVALGATIARAVPLAPRDDFFDFGGGGELFGDAGNSIGDGFSSSIAEGSGLGGGSFDVGGSSFVGDDLAFAGSGAEAIDLMPSVDVSAIPPDTNVYVDPSPQVVSDVPTPGLGAGDGDLIAVGPTTPGTSPASPGSGLTISFDNNVPVAEFTPTNSGLIESLENVDLANIASSSDVTTPAPGDPVPITPDPGALLLILGCALGKLSALRSPQLSSLGASGRVC